MAQVEGPQATNYSMPGVFKTWPLAGLHWVAPVLLSPHFLQLCLLEMIRGAVGIKCGEVSRLLSVFEERLGPVLARL